jgi:sugar (pentulose or hexulose) kinase
VAAVTPPATGTVTRDDIAAKLAEIQGEIRETGERAKVPVLAVGAVAVAALVVGAYLLGRRRGRKRTTVVEVRRL